MGVAGIHRLLDNLHKLDDVDVVLVVAGMDGALPAVVVCDSSCIFARLLMRVVRHLCSSVCGSVIFESSIRSKHHKLKQCS